MLKGIRSKFKSDSDFVIVVICAFLLSFVVGMYLYERGQTTEDIFSFYGNIPTKDVFVFPERTAFYTFGSAPGPIPMHFHNEMWCRPIDRPDLRFREVDFRENTYVDNFEFVNPLPDVASKNERNKLAWSDYGLEDRKQVRTGGDTYLSWEMDVIHPTESSDCYIDAVLTTKTRFFGLNKSLFVPDVGRFQYIVPITE